MSDSAALPRSVVIAQRLQVLEVEAAVQRAQLAATFGQWQRRGTLAWLTTTAVSAAKMAGGVLATPTARWVLATLVMRLIRGRA
ncbi:MAG TPA: hypothetical protein VGV09_10125 [Steroidobacteraceae bacterium]|nr:hypothetical protein [Steroidobacteraceae bacterium]